MEFLQVYQDSTPFIFHRLSRPWKWQTILPNFQRYQVNYSFLQTFKALKKWQTLLPKLLKASVELFFFHSLSSLEKRAADHAFSPKPSKTWVKILIFHSLSRPWKNGRPFSPNFQRLYELCLTWIKYQPDTPSLPSLRVQRRHRMKQQV